MGRPVLIAKPESPREVPEKQEGRRPKPTPLRDASPTGEGKEPTPLREVEHATVEFPALAKKKAPSWGTGLSRSHQ